MSAPTDTVTGFSVAELPGSVGTELRRRGVVWVGLLDETPTDPGENLLLVGVPGAGGLALLLDYPNGRVWPEQLSARLGGGGGAGGEVRVRWAQPR
jgi:hypothetical protein